MVRLQKVRCREIFLGGGEPSTWLARLSDFVPQQRSQGGSVLDVDFGDSVPDPVEFIQQNGAQFTVYSVDFDLRVLGLVRVKEGIDIRKAPFLYQAQRENAVELLLLPFDVLPAVADALTGTLTLSTVKNIFLHNIGRCGSTLLCRALDVTDEIQAVSEPDIFTLMYMFKCATRDVPLTSEESEEIIMLLRCSVILLNFYFIQNDPSKTVMQKAFDLIREDSVNFFHACLTFKQLLEHKEQIILEVLEKLDVDVPSDLDSSKIREVFGVDSQEGSVMQSERRKGDKVRSSWVGTWEKNLFSTVLEHFNGDVDEPDFVMPNTVMLN
ncbi:Hypp4664 [Branchiostoma lanceolatum]|uniref:Hypp4664 protein n=1 Tax=Branchiostoma lanceolatum TaxID=7740 RepID=A0A8K0F2A8_BRALA|nr:Hypp4664 [Branchiostoma lanceolatum]